MPDTLPELPVDARSPMCQRVLRQIRDFEGVHKIKPSYFCAPASSLGVMFTEMELLYGARPKGIEIDGVPIVAIEMLPQYERTTEPLH